MKCMLFFATLIATTFAHAVVVKCDAVAENKVVTILIDINPTAGAAEKIDLLVAGKNVLAASGDEVKNDVVDLGSGNFPWLVATLSATVGEAMVSGRVDQPATEESAKSLITFTANVPGEIAFVDVTFNCLPQ